VAITVVVPAPRFSRACSSAPGKCGPHRGPSTGVGKSGTGERKSRRPPSYSSNDMRSLPAFGELCLVARVGLNDPGVVGKDHGLGTIANFKLRQHPLHVSLDRAFRNH